MRSSPRALFFTSDSQRVALARQRYFDEGEIPTGVVKREVLDSWARCQRMRLSPTNAIEFNEVSLSRAHLALQRNRLLIEAWANETSEIERTLAGTECSAILTDATGVLIAATGEGDAQAHITRTAHRVGINLAEEAVGTTAPGLVLKTGQPAVVLGGEHYFDSVRPMYCAAAPIRNVHGQLAGVLDISSEHKPFEFDVAAVVGLYATCIENRLLLAQSHEYLVVRMQISPSLLDTPMTGLAGLDSHGHLVWTNNAASRMLGIDTTGVQSSYDVESLFGLPLHRMQTMYRPSPMRLANGLSVWIQADAPYAEHRPVMSAGTSEHSEPPENTTVTTNIESGETAIFVPTPSEPATQELSPPASTLRDVDKTLIEQTVQACNGNISKAAKQLGVSRGLIYRRLGKDQLQSM